MPLTAKSPAISLTLLAVGAAALVYSLTRFWGANPEYVDRFLILAGAAYAVSEAWPTLRELPLKPTRLGYLPLLIGAIAFPIGWFLQAQIAPKPIVLWWLAGAWVLTAAGLILLGGGRSHLRKLAFPLGFLLFALPVPNRILGPLQFLLQSATTTAAEWLLPILGVPVERHGFMLSLPGGDLGVAEACSGVRSVTALTAIAAFVAWWRQFGFVRGMLLVVLSVPVIAAVNVVRVVASGLIQEHFSTEYVRGNWHEAFGVVMVLVGLGLLVALASLMAPRSNPQGERGLCLAPPSFSGKGVGGLGSNLLLVCSAIASVAAQFLGVGTEQELVAAAPLDQIPHQIGRWKATDLPVPEDVSEMLTADSITRRVYSDLGYEVHVWVIYWSSRNMVKGYHHPDVCWPNRGFRLSRRDTINVTVGTDTISVTLREFNRGSEQTAKPGREKDQQLILYWTQEGRRIWTEDDERQAQATGGASHDWLGERLTRQEQRTPSGRITVLFGTQLWGDGITIRKQTLELAGGIASELYRVCPWARPREQ
ncbi:MAG: EpsI family protein [Planctomycetes bacterium]|nr:EpsI family protein [Planctomycetota bacterium]